MLAQHRDTHARSLGEFVTIQLAAGSRTVAALKASPTTKDATVLINIVSIR